MSKEKFRNSSAIAQMNYTSEVMLNHYKSWLQEEQMQLEQQEGEIDPEDRFDPESKIGGPVSFQTMRGKLKELNRLFNQFKIFFRSEVLSLDKIMDFSPTLSQLYYFSIGFHNYDPGSVTIERRMRQVNIIRGIGEVFIQATMQEKDDIFEPALDALSQFVHDNRKDIKLRIKNAGSTDAKSYNPYMAKIENDKVRGDIMSENDTFNLQFPKVDVYPGIPFEEPFDILFYYTGPPYNIVDNPYRLFFRNVDRNQFPERNLNNRNIKKINTATIDDAQKFVVNMNNTFKELESMFSIFSKEYPKFSVAELKELNDNVTEIRDNFKKMVDDGYYISLLGTTIANVLGDAKQKTPTKRIYDGMVELHDDHIKIFDNTYLSLFSNLKQQKNF